MQEHIPILSSTGRPLENVGQGRPEGGLYERLEGGESRDRDLLQGLGALNRRLDKLEEDLAHVTGTVIAIVEIAQGRAESAADFGTTEAFDEDAVAEGRANELGEPE